MILFSFLYLTHLKLYYLLFRNVNSRKVFEDVAHFQALSSSGRANVGELNAFFTSPVVSGIYIDFVKFTEIHKLPKAVLLLKDIKLA
jgi:hypothetical protein